MSTYMDEENEFKKQNKNLSGIKVQIELNVNGCRKQRYFYYCIKNETRKIPENIKAWQPSKIKTERNFRP